MDNREEHEKEVCSLLLRLGQDATEIYLLGDIFDFWYEFVWQKPEEYRFTLDTLKSLTERGITIHYFIGNHDIWTFGWLSKQTGVLVHRKPEEAIINGKSCYLAHGDGLVPSDMMKRYPKQAQNKIKRFMALRRLFHNPILQRLFALLPPSWGNKFGYGWARKSRIKELANPIGYKGENEEELVLFAKEKERTEHFDYYIFGHRHIELDLELATGSRVLILGDLFRQWTYAAMDDNGKMTILNKE